MLAKNSRFVQTCPNVKETYLREENNEQTKKILKRNYENRISSLYLV